VYTELLFSFLDFLFRTRIYDIIRSVLTFSRKDFAPFPLINKAVLLENNLKCVSFKISRGGTFIYAVKTDL
jgi:hypothetical protein